MYNLTQFVLRSLISFSLVFFFVCFYCPFTPANLFILLTCIHIYSLFSFTIHLIMTEVRSKRRVLPLIFIVKGFKKPLLIRLMRIACDNITCWFLWNPVERHKGPSPLDVFHKDNRTQLPFFLPFHCWFVNVYLSSVTPA